MDLLKEVEKLVERKHKALENLKRKEKYLAGAETSFKKARRELKVTNAKLKIIRKQIKAQGIESFDVPESPIESEPVVIHTPLVKPTPITEVEPVEENTDD